MLDRLVGSHNNLEVWWMTPLCLMWYIWRERNVRCFEDCETNIMFKSFYTRIVAYHSPHFCSFSDFLDFCSFSHY